MTPATSSPTSDEPGARSLRSLEPGASRHGLFSLLAACCLLLAACGDDDGDGIGSTAAEQTTSTPAAPEPDRQGGSAKAPPTGNGEGGVELTEIGEFEAPLWVTQPPGQSEDLYVVEQGGTIQRVSPDGSRSTFLDISDEVTAEGEQGLLSVAFSPDYERDGLLYVDYTDLEGDSRIAEYEATNGTVDEATRRELLRIDDPYPNHNGGLLLFGPDDMLYIGLGDGGAADDPDRTALDLSSLFGKIMRIDPSPDGDLPYTVPADNPFAGQEGARGEVYSYGLRNPWRFSFDSLTEDLTIGDVGQDEEEEIDVVAAGDGSGANFGWSAFEGNQRFNDDQAPEGAIPPALVATHEEGNCSITGGLTVRDPDLPSLYGRYIWGDLCLGELRSFTPVPGETAADDVALGESIEQLASFGTDNDENVYAISISGGVFRLDPAS